MKGVTFDGKHSFKDFGLFLKSFSIETPEPKLQTVDIHGVQGVIDLSEMLGEIFYKNRKLTFEFVAAKDSSDALVLLSKVEAYMHGKIMQVTLDDDPRFYYLGRVVVDKFKTDSRSGLITVVVDAEPYKYEYDFNGDDWLWDPFDFETGIIRKTAYEVHGSLTVDLINRAMIVSPVFSAIRPMLVTFNNKTYQIPAGTSKAYDIRLQEGSNIVTFKGNGVVSVKYKGGAL